jgi:hypothetical protein
MAAWWLGLAWRRLALAVLDYGGLVARASLAKAALAVARKLALGGSEALAVARKLALGGGCSEAEPRAIWLHGRLDDSTVE